MFALAYFLWETDCYHGQMYVRTPYRRNLSSLARSVVVGVIKLLSSKPCTSRSLPRLHRLSLLKGLTFLIDWNVFTHPYHYRTYAITMKNKWIAGFLYALATVELGLGVYFFTKEATNPGRYFHLIVHYVNIRVQELNFPKISSSAATTTIPLGLYKLCSSNSNRRRGWVIAQTTLYLVFGEKFVVLPYPHVP